LKEPNTKDAILIIDDDEGSCETLKDIFEEQGYHVSTALDGRKGLETIRRGRFQVALVDIKLPDIDGVNLIKRIKAKDPKLYVIMITAFASIENTIDALNRGAYSYFTKPLNIEEVKNRIRKAIEHYRSEEEKLRLEGEVERRAAELETIARITLAINESLNPRDVLLSITGELKKVIPFDWMRVSLLGEEDNTLRVFAEASGSGEVRAGFRGGKGDGPVERWVLLNREPVLLPDIHEQNLFHIERGFYPQDLQSLLAVPLISRGRAIGVFCLGSGKRAAYGEAHRAFFTQIGGQFSVALDNARAYEEILKAKESLEKDVVELKGKMGERFGFQNIIVKSEEMREVMTLISRVLHSDSTVLLQGESGTGKELLAHFLHYSGPRKNRAFVTVNCGAIPEHLLESELFGFEKGAFTSADRSKEGLLEKAHMGTFFLDEVDELARSLQVKLLRVLQDGEVRRLGEVESRRVNVRLIAATNRDIGLLVKDGRFREDLFYRLNVFPVWIPPLRERREDILPLAEHFFVKYRGKAQGELKGFSQAAKKALISYSWPGNVREVENIVEKSVHIAEGGWIEEEDLGLGDALGTASALGMSLEEEREAFSKKRIEDVLKKNLGNKARTARELGIHRTQLYRYLEKYGLG
jgi:DNA-binding NtrC family response regulator